MSDGPEVWVDYDHPPLSRNYEQCRQCGGDRSFQHHCDLLTEMMKLRGMIWWLASDLAADDGDPTSTSETWVALAEKHWRQGLRYAARLINPA